MTISALPSLRQPESIDPKFYFTSDSFLNKIKHDINLLISNFKSRSTSSSSSSSSIISLGPFLTFKMIYLKTGWNLIHLSVIDSSLRKVWFNTIIRLFLDYLKVENDPFEQIAALFSIYTFWSTQSKILGDQFNVILDLNMLNYIKSIPKNLGIHLNQTYKTITDQLPSHIPSTSTLKPNQPKLNSHLDPSLFSISSSQPTQLLPSHSLYQIVTHLIQQNAFLIQPIQTALVYPHLPTNSFKLESSLNSILSSNHLNKSTSSLHSKSSFSEQIISTQDEINRWIQSNWNLTDLRQIRSQYLSKKSKLIQDHFDFNSIFTDAIKMTLQVIEKNGPGLNYLLDSNHQIETEEENQTKEEEEEKEEKEEKDHEKENHLKAIRLVDSGESLEEWDEALKSLKSNL